MGQQASLSHDNTIETEAISFQKDKISFAKKNPSFIESIDTEESCMNFCNFQPKKPEKWKIDTLKHLKALKSEYWPDLLAKTLKQAYNEKLDTIYKADMYYMINKSNLSALSPIKESSSSIKDSFKNSRPDIKFSLSQVPISVYTGSRGPEQLNFIPSGPFDDIKDKNLSAIREDKVVEKSLKAGRRSSTGQLDSFADASIREEAMRNSFPSRVIRIGKTSTKIQLDKPYQQSVQNYSIRETDLDFMNTSGCRLKFDIAMSLLEKHLADRRNIFYKLITEFQTYLLERYQDLEKTIGLRRDLEELYNKITDDIKQFVMILQESVKHYYGFQRIKKQHIQEYDNVFCKNNFIHALTTMVFNKDIHKLVLRLCGIKNVKTEEFCIGSFKVWKNLDPQQFGVNDKFALNHRTIQNIRQESSVTFGNDDTFVKKEDISSDTKFNMKPNSIGETSIHAKMAPFDDSLPSENNFKPYEKAIVEICLARNKASPAEKYKIILRVGELIIRSIRDFYQGSKDKLELNLSVNDLLPIFFYIIVKSEFYDIFTHAQLVESFVPKEMLLTAGYEYLKIIEAIGNFLYTKTLRNSYNPETVGANLQEFFYNSILKVDQGICLEPKLED